MSKDVAVSVVIDTNVLVPSLYKVSPIMQFILSGHLVPIWNQFIINEAKEIIDRLWGKVYSKRVEPTQLAEVYALLDYVRKSGYSVPEMPMDWPRVSGDRDDDHFLWTAVAGKAEYLITRDRRHLLRLKSFAGVLIGRPSDFFQWAIATHPI